MGSANNVVGTMTAYMIQGTAATNVSNVQEAKNSSNAAGISFDNILNKVNNTMIQRKLPDASRVSKYYQNSAVKSDNTNKGADNKDVSISADTTDENNNSIKSQEVTKDTKAPKTDEANETQGKEADTKLQEAITGDGKELINKITEIFDLSEDEVIDAMQVLGLMAADLLNPANLQQLVTDLTGEEQAIDLLTDSDIYTSLQDLMEGAESMKSELMNEFDLSEEGMQTAIKANDESFKAQLQDKVSDNPVITENVKGDVTKEMNVKKTDAPQSEAFADKAPEEEPIVEITTESAKSGSEKHQSFQSGAESSNLFNQVMNNIIEASVDQSAVSDVTYADKAQMENIIRQITEKITISAKAEETTMELSLHPASLGNVNILLSSGKDGIIAKFTAQNQIVKEAVEAQMVQLQQKFDEQGIKVTSIEVTIASHGFEQNLEQGNDRQQGEPSDERKVKPLRRINLSELTAEDEEIINDAERIAVQMMTANGNSVDFSA